MRSKVSSTELFDIPMPIEKEKVIHIIAYCLMPTHIHMLLEEVKEDGISIFTNNVLNSYTRYFNTKHKRKGPLWEGPSKKVTIKSDDQLLHLTRYIHLNPVTAYLCNKPEEWPYSSYNEYIKPNTNNNFCDYEHY